MVYIRHMTRTQIYLPEDVYLQIKLTAKREGKPAAFLIRKYIVSGIKKGKKTTAREALLGLVKLGIKGPGDLSTRHDDYLYGNG